MLLIIDFYEKMAVSSKRREQMNKVKKKNQTNNNTKPKQNVKNTATNYSSEVKNEMIGLGTAIKMSIYEEGKGGGKSSILLVYILITLGFLY